MPSTKQTDMLAMGSTEVTKDALMSLRFYRAVWRWHFYAGLFVIPFLLLLATTGIIYLFKPQLDALMYQDLLFVDPSGEVIAATQQLGAVQEAYPNATIAQFIPPSAVNRSAQINLTSADGRSLAVFINPYNNEILGERNEENTLQYYALTLHGELMIGKWGDYLVEIAACWGLVLVISGLYLWWPRKESWLWGVLLPRLRTPNRRLFWRDLHAVPGFWGAFVLIFMLLTGLPWTGFWGDQFANVWNQYPAGLWSDIPLSNKPTGSLNTTSNKIVPWAAEQLPLPQSDVSAHTAHAQPGNGNAAALATDAGIPVGTPVDLDSVVALGFHKGAPAGFSVSLPDSEVGVYTISAFPDDATQQTTIHVDQYSGQILADLRFNDYGLVPKAVELGISLHEGKFFGFWNQMLMLLVCLLVMLLCLSGVVMWWQRRPVGRLGVPAMPQNLPLWKGAVVLMSIMGLLFPLMGASLVIILLLDYLLIARVPVLKHALH